MEHSGGRVRPWDVAAIRVPFTHLQLLLHSKMYSRYRTSLRVRPSTLYYIHLPRCGRYTSPLVELGLGVVNHYYLGRYLLYGT
jgi:hypothetical protein